MLDSRRMGLGLVFELRQERRRPANQRQKLSRRFEKPPKLVGDFAELGRGQLRLRDHLPTCGQESTAYGR